MIAGAPIAWLPISGEMDFFVVASAAITLNSTISVDLPERLSLSLPGRQVVTIIDDSIEVDLPTRVTVGG